MASNYSGKGVPLNGSVYICNLPEGTDENMIAEHFGTIGLLKVVAPPKNNLHLLMLELSTLCQIYTKQML